MDETGLAAVVEVGQGMYAFFHFSLMQDSYVTASRFILKVIWQILHESHTE